MIVRITQTVKTDICVDTDDAQAAIAMVVRQEGDFIECHYSEPRFATVQIGGGHEEDH